MGKISMEEKSTSTYGFEQVQAGVIKIPKGTDVTFIFGKVEAQISRETGDIFKGGGFQVRFRDFDEKWIVETRRMK